MTHSVSILSVNVSALMPLVPDVKRTRTGIHKRPVSGSVRVHALGLEGDRVGNTRYHGGPDQAVYLYSAEDYAWWSEQLGIECRPGLFGENVTIDRWWPAPRLGDRLVVGDVILELSAPRIPCNTLATRMDDPLFVKRFAEAGRPGSYVRVLAEGTLAAGTSGVAERPQVEWPTIAETNAIWFARTRNRDRLQAMIAAPIAFRYRETLLKWAVSAR